MSYCPKCHVELAPRAESCPLCQALPVNSLDSNQENYPTLPEMHSGVPFAPEERNAEEGEKLTPTEYRKMVAELLAVSIGIVLAVTVLMDSIFFQGITWSRYTSIALIVLWVSSAIPLILWNHPWLVFFVLGPTVLLSVFMWFVFAGHLSVFLPVGLPITLLLEGVVLSSSVLISLQHRKGLNAVGVVLAAIGIVCAGIDIILTFYLQGKILLTWSIIVGISAIPVAGFFFYLHYRVTNKASLRKLFRL